MNAYDGTNERIVVFILGDVSGLADVRQALERHDEIELIGAAPTLAAADAMAGVDLDAVLLATPDASLPRDELAAIRESTSAPVIVLAPASAPHLLEGAVAVGAADALLMPQPAEGVVFSIHKVAATRTAPSPAARGFVVTVFSPKGGTGKSIAATNLAVALAKCEARTTLLIDLDLQFGDAAVMLGVQPLQTIHELVTAPGDIDADKVGGYVVRHESGLDVLAAPHRPEEAELVAPARTRLVLEAAREAYDVVVVDSSPFVHAPFLAALDESDLLLLVATPEVPALKDVRQSLETLELIRFPQERIAMVLNRANAKSGISRADVEAALGIRMTYTLPSDAVVPLCINRGRPAVLAEPRSEFAKAVRAIAADVASKRPARARAGAVAEV
jgi:pilus assembly protein CpaE